MQFHTHIVSYLATGGPLCPLTRPDSSPSFYKRLLASGSPRPPQAWDEPFLRGALSSVSGKWYLEAKTQMLDVLNAVGVSLPLGFLKGQS